MRLNEKQAAELRLWAAGKLEGLTESDSDILADYVVALLANDAQIDEVRKNVVSELAEILLEDTTQFVAELFVKATLHLRQPLQASSVPAASRPAIRNPLPISQARSALRNAHPLSNAPPGSRKRTFVQAYGSDDQQPHIGKHRGTKRGRGSSGVSGSVPRGTWRGRGRGTPAATGASMQQFVDLGHDSTPANLPKPPTAPPGMPAFMAMFPYMAAMIASSQRMMPEKETCNYFDAHGYCMRGDVCPYEHVKQGHDVEARHKTGEYASDNDLASETSREESPFTRRMYSSSNTPMRCQPSQIANDLSHTPEEPDKPKTPEVAELDIKTFKAKQTNKQQDHDMRLATIKKTEAHKVQLARKLAEMDANIQAEKMKLMAKPGGDKILAQINENLEKKRASYPQTGSSELEQTAIDNGIDPDVMSIGGTPDSQPRRASSALSYPPALSDAGGYKGKNPAICRFFPNCTNPTCTFKHTAESPASVVFCKFFPNCTNAACTFKHGNDSNKSDVDCKYLPNCTNPRCPFKHPDGNTRSETVKRVDNRPKSLLISGVGVSLNNGVDSMNMVRVAVMSITACESIQPQSFHDPSNSADDAHDGLIVTFTERWQADEVQRRLTMVGGVGRVKCAWYFGPLHDSVTDAFKTELEVNSVDGEESDANGDVKMDDTRLEDEDLDVAGEDDWIQIS